MRMCEPGGLDAIVTPVSESEPFNFLYKKNNEGSNNNWIKNGHTSSPVNPKTVAPRKNLLN